MPSPSATNGSHIPPFPPFTLWVTVPGSSTDISEDWEKDFDLDMTEEEVQVALSKADASGEVSGPDWPQGSQPRIPVSDGRSPSGPAVP